MLRPLRISDPQKAALKRISTIHALCRIGRFGLEPDLRKIGHLAYLPKTEEFVLPLSRQNTAHFQRPLSVALDLQLA